MLKGKQANWREALSGSWATPILIDLIYRVQSQFAQSKGKLADAENLFDTDLMEQLGIPILAPWSINNLPH